MKNKVSFLERKKLNRKREGNRGIWKREGNFLSENENVADSEEANMVFKKVVLCVRQGV